MKLPGSETARPWKISYPKRIQKENNHLGGGFKHVLFLTLPREMIQFD